jgi:PAS domain S-box-containing protein
MKKEFNRRYEDLFKFVPIGFFTFDHGGQILEVNPTGAKLLGTRRSDLLKQKFTNYIVDDFQDGFQHHCKKVFESGNRETYDLRILKKDRASFWAQLESIAIKAPNRSANGRHFNTAITDITNRKQAEDALCSALESLEHSEERFRSVVETAIDAIITVDSRGTIIFWNPQAELMFGYSANDMIGKPVAVIMPERFRQAHQLGLSKAAACKKSKIIENTLELVGRRKDGNEFSLELSLANWETKEGVFFTAIIRDISERKQAESALQAARNELERRVDERTIELGTTNEKLRKQVSECERAELALRESEQKYATLVEDALIGVYILKDGKIEFANDKFADIYGYSKDELIGMDSLDLVHPYDRPLVKKLREKRLKGEKVPVEYESKGLKKNGDIIWVMRSFSQINYKGGAAISGIVADITKRRKAEEALRKSDKELRILSNQLLSAEEKERKRIARELHDGIGQALSAIKFSVENALLELREATNPIDLGIRIETTIDIKEDEVPRHLKTIIYRILQEALNNVAKHSRANFVHLRLRKNETRMELIIHDSGRGFNLDQAMALKTSRRGFGLASMRERAELSGAAFEINSIIGRGTTVRVVWTD